MRDIDEALRDVDAQLRGHPYLDALARGEVTEEGLRAAAALWHQAIVSDLCAAAMMVQRFGHTPARDFLNGFLQSEFAALDGLRPILRKLGLRQDDVESYEPSFEGMAFSHHMAWLAAQASAAEFTVAALVTVPTWEANCTRMGRALRASYGFTEQETALLEASAEILPIEERALPVIQDGLKQGVEPRHLHRASRFALISEQWLWDAMLTAGQREWGGARPSAPH
jgi:hypothetical protein